MNITKIYIPLFVMFVVTACAPIRNKSQALFDFGVPDDEVNTRIRLSIPEEINTLKIGDDIAIDVEIISSTPVSFQFDYGAKMFVQNNDAWVKIENLTEYPPGDLLLFPAHGDYFKHGLALMYPIISDNTQSVKIRVILQGFIVEDSIVTNKKTVAYIDLDLKP